MVRRALLLAVMLAITAGTAWPQDADSDDDATRLDEIVVHSTGLRGVRAFDVPASLNTVVLDDGNRANAIASEALSGLPGLIARDRQNHAQDAQLSIRGFGSRSTFGVRGLRLYADGIPASMPDGQGQLSHFNLAGAERIEVLRGPFSALYGNSSGGVVQLFSADGQAGDPWRFRATTGSDNTWTASANLQGGTGRSGYNVALTRFSSDGYRDHSAARRDSANIKLHTQFDENRRLDVIVNYLDLPDAQDPLGLTEAQYRDNPRQATSVAHQFNTRKSVRQPQLGIHYDHALNDSSTVRARAHAGERQVVQYLALPAAAQANPLNSGGVIDLDNRFAGVDLRWIWRGELAGRATEFTLGANGDQQRQHRRGFENFVGDTLGIRGRPRRDEHNRVGNTDQFAQLWWQVGDRWSLLAGARHSTVRFRSNDDYVTASNPDDSGRVEYSQTAPVAGVMFAPSDNLRLYLSAGRGFETPTFNELSYRADGGAGLAFDLRPAISDNIELGLKWRSAQGSLLETALFRADTDDELAVARNVGGRSSFSNVGAARREGVEATWTQAIGQDWDLRLAYTWIDATFRDGYLICSGTGCTVPATPVPAGSRIPGVAEQQAYVRLQWTGERWNAAAEVIGAGDVIANDLATARAAGYGVLNLELAHIWPTRQGPLRAFVRVDNAFHRHYVGSVIVNEGNGRFYEPGPGRTWLAGLQWSWQR